MQRHAGDANSHCSPLWSTPGATFSAWAVSMHISATRRLQSSPATRGRPGHSAQGIWADGSMTLDELHRIMWLRHAADGRPGQERDYERGLRLFV
eukprot:3033692-Prymnesium_polylepis.1